ncbi:Growth_factor receptor cysteine-rich domain superfamily [Hexamita inflata]|uniref:Growth factor receptor cysteine-rich domain superfamily n=1 Tax=Hexamita inflata TaxID=28002 RepID=A0AA86UBC2_9EUKA|nr:Growth factor receptor cysteine-rich domain superfamily [Hexamita inflata]
MSFMNDCIILLIPHPKTIQILLQVFNQLNNITDFICPLNQNIQNNQQCQCPTNFEKQFYDNELTKYFRCICTLRSSNSECSLQCPDNHGCEIMPCQCTPCESPKIQSPEKQICVDCEEINSLSLFDFSSKICICGPGTEGTFPNCVCKQYYSQNQAECRAQIITKTLRACTNNEEFNPASSPVCECQAGFDQNFIPQANGRKTCTCSKRLDSNNNCALTCPAGQGCDTPFCTCAPCASPLVQNLAQQKCVTCESINARSYFDTTSQSCQCGLGTEIAFPNCKCLTGFSPIIGGCTCGLRSSSLGCNTTCPEGQGCSTMPCSCVTCLNPQVQNVDKTMCVSCSSINPLSFYKASTSGCVCGSGTNGAFPNCVCKTEFVASAGMCICPSDKFSSSDLSTCVTECNPNEFKLISGAVRQCMLCSGNNYPSVDKTRCVGSNCQDIGYLNHEGTFCVSSCVSGYPDANRRCQLCATINILGKLQSQTCVCDSTADPRYSFPNCQCYSNYVVQGSTCVCLFMKAADGIGCVSSCLAEQLSNSSSMQCQTCSVNLIPNSAKDQCVPRTCYSEFLNTAGTYCVVSCLSLEAVPNASRQCVFCPIKISQDQQNCIAACPPTQISNPKLCQICTYGTVPNVYKNACVSHSSCGSGFLNIAETFCVSSCLTEFGYPSGGRCLQCNNQTQLGVWAQSSCACSSGFGVVGIFPSCYCHPSFVQQGASCSCSQKVSLDGSQCLSSCPASQVFLEGAVQCSLCPAGTAPNKDQTDCVSATCSSAVFRNGAKFVFCFRGSQTNRVVDSFIAFASDGPFYASLFLQAKKMQSLRIEGHVQNSPGMTVYSLNIMGSLKVVQSEINVSITAIAAAGLQTFGELSVIFSQINISARYDQFCLGYELRPDSSDFTLFVERAQLNIHLVSRSEDSQFGLVDSEIAQNANITHSTVSVSMAGSSNSFFGVCHSADEVHLSSVAFTFVVSSQTALFVGVAKQVASLTIDGSNFSFQIAAGNAFGLLKTVSISCRIYNTKMSGMITADNVSGMIENSHGELEIHTLYFGLVARGSTSSCGLVKTAQSPWVIDNLLYVGFSQNPQQPVFGSNCGCSGSEYKADGLCYTIQ